MLVLIPTRKSGITSICRGEKDTTLGMDEIQSLVSVLGHGSRSTVETGWQNHNTQGS